ncbi:low-density lipoprotein receptor-related protein 5-like [Clytia hemisphaerica]|uniref:Uncharacterized protein n=1 Tax=Clytia hemisphaerica TaxID=252671 RepID=A0A7M5WQ73_9CNID
MVRSIDLMMGYFAILLLIFSIGPPTVKGNAEEFIIFAKANETRFLDLDPVTNPQPPYAPIDSEPFIVGVAFDYEDDVIFTSDLRLSEIVRMHPNGSNKEVIANGSRSDGLAWDWVNERLYWTEYVTDTIRRYSPNNQSGEILVDQGLEKPLAIVLNPCNEYAMYWTDWGASPSIKKASMDGENVTVIISTDITYPNGLAIDIDEGRLYWADSSYDRIESSDLEGRDRLVILSSIPHVFGLTLFKDDLYWTDWTERWVALANKNGQDPQVVLVDNLDQNPMAIKVFAKRNGTCWSQWSVWSDCDRPCGVGFHKRSRMCYNTASDTECIGNDVELLKCNEHLCPDICNATQKACSCSNVPVIYDMTKLQTNDTFYGINETAVNNSLATIAKWNAQEITLLCKEARCRESDLEATINELQVEEDTVQTSLNTVMDSQILIRKMIDCHANVWSRKGELFDHYEQLCQRKVIIQQVLSDLKIKKIILENEKKRCADRSWLRTVLEETWHRTIS